MNLWPQLTLTRRGVRLELVLGAEVVKVNGASGSQAAGS